MKGLPSREKVRNPNPPWCLRFQNNVGGMGNPSGIRNAPGVDEQDVSFLFTDRHMGMTETGNLGTRLFRLIADIRQIPFDMVPVTVSHEKAETILLPKLFIGHFFPVAVSADHRPGNVGKLVHGRTKISAVNHVIRLNILHDPDEEIPLAMGITDDENSHFLPPFPGKGPQNGKSPSKAGATAEMPSPGD